jgi:hypothetical protein
VGYDDMERDRRRREQDKSTDTSNGETPSLREYRNI